jgi:lipid A 3-O-deacylase
MKSGIGFVLGCAGLLAGCASLPPQPSYTQSSLPPISEVRGGVFEHDALSPERGSADVSAEVLFNKPWTSSDPFWNVLLPRPDIGGTANFAGKTSEAYAGAAWDYNITDKIFAGTSFGGSVNNGFTGNVVPPGHNAVGCNWGFRESGTLGYRLTQNWSLMGSIEHMSNAGFCVQNRGVTNGGLRLGYSF